MAAWQTASTSTTDDTGGLPARHHLWPDFVVRWLFGAAKTNAPPGRSRARSPGSRTSASVARQARRRHHRADGRQTTRLEGLRRGAGRGHRAPDGGLPRRGPHARRAGAQRRPGLAVAPPRRILRPAGGLSRPPGQADRSDRPRRRVDPRWPRGELHAAAAVDADGPHHRAVEGARRSGWPSGWASPSARPGGPPGISTAAGSISIAPCTAPNSSDPHNFDLVLDSNSLGLEIATEVIVRAVEAGRPQGVATSPLLRPGSADRGAPKAERSLTASDIWGAPLPVPADSAEMPTPGARSTEVSEPASGQ